MVFLCCQTKEVNVVFVDNPVGTGYSYVEDPKLLPRNNTAIAHDLIKFMSGFFVKVCMCVYCSFHIYCIYLRENRAYTGIAPTIQYSTHATKY